MKLKQEYNDDIFDDEQGSDESESEEANHNNHVAHVPTESLNHYED